jgi:hypothetical protein
VETELSRFRLPVSGREVALRQPSGAEDLLLLEAGRGPGGDARLALALAGRLARDAAEGGAVDWAAQCVTDVDALVLRLRQALLGDRVRADVPCAAPGCGRRIDIDFGVETFLTHHTPKAAACEPAGEPGWFRLTRGPESGRFRLPTVADQLAVAFHPDPAKELARRCVRPTNLAARPLRKMETAMEALAPSLSADLEGLCPECGATVAVYFEARWFCLRELRQRAAFLYQEVDVLARRYHWSEADILALPPLRRAAYAELARAGGGG